MRTAINELISAARGQAERLRRQSFAGSDDEYPARVAEAESQHWKRLADAAEAEAAGLILNLRPD